MCYTGIIIVSSLFKVDISLYLLRQSEHQQVLLRFIIKGWCTPLLHLYVYGDKSESLSSVKSLSI